MTAEPECYVSRKSLAELHAEGSHVAVATAIHRTPLRSGNGVPLYAHPPSTGQRSAMSKETLMAMVDAAMVEMSNIHPPLKRSECERLILAALDAYEGVAPVPDIVDSNPGSALPK